MEAGEFSASYLPQFLDGAAAQGFCKRSILRDCGLDPGLLNRPHDYITFSEFNRLQFHVVSLLNDEDHGLFRQPQNRGYLELLVSRLVACSNLHEALDQLIHKSNARNTGLTHRLITRGITAEYQVDGENGAWLNPFALETLLFVRHRILCWLCKVRITVTSLQLPHQPQPWARQHERMYPYANVTHGRECCAITFDRIHLGNPIVRSLEELPDLLSESFSPMPPVTIRLGPKALQTRDYIFEQMLAGEKPPGMGTAARALSTNAHTLHRALLREGTSFRQVLATAKQDYALILLRQRELGIETVASNLGYAEVSSFSRAFKQWTGKSPLAYRKQQ